MGGVEFPPCWFCGLRHPSTGGYRLFGGANGGLQEDLCKGVLPRASAACVLVPAVSHIHPMPQQEIISYGVIAPSLWVSCTHYFVCALQKWSLCFPQSC